MAKLVTEFLDDAVKICPDKTAFVDNGQKITYKELQEKAYGISCTIVGKADHYLSLQISFRHMMQLQLYPPSL